LGGGATTITDDYALSIVNRRPENNVSSLTVMVDDYQSKSYSDLFDVHTQIDLQVKNATAGYVTTFSGLIYNLKPSITSASGGETLEVQAWGWGIALAKTTCDTSYGAESANISKTHPQEIIQDIVTNYVKKRWGDSDTQWDLDNSDVEAVHNAFDITNITSQYLDNFTLINKILDVTSAYAVINSDVAPHWYVDTDTAGGAAGHLRVKEIDQDSGDGEWTHYYGGNAANATFKEGVNDVLARGFHRNINDYANNVVVAAAYRYPAFDRWTESTTGWADDDVTLTVDEGGGVGEPAGAVVGTYMLKAVAEIAGTCYFYYDFPAARDFTYLGSRNNIPKLGFYLAADDISASPQIGVNFYETRGVDWWEYVDEIAANTLQYKLIADSEFQYFEIPIGPYAEVYHRDHAYSGAAVADKNYHWTVGGGISDWTSIAGIEFQFDGGAGPPYNAIFVDDIHIAGHIVRSCYDASEITATTREHQVIMRMDNAVDDTLVADDDDAGMAAMIALSELHRRKAKPVTGTMTFPLIEDMLPGQTLQIYAGLESDGSTYRWSNLPMRIKEIVHQISTAGFTTQVNLTSDVTHTFATGLTTMWDTLMDSAGALKHGQARDLKASGIDNLIKRLAWDPT
jgi:hypothetical protein